MPAAGLSLRTRNAFTFERHASRNEPVMTAHTLIAVFQRSSPSLTDRSRCSTKPSRSSVAMLAMGLLPSVFPSAHLYGSIHVVNRDSSSDTDESLARRASERRPNHFEKVSPT